MSDGSHRTLRRACTVTVDNPAAPPAAPPFSPRLGNPAPASGSGSPPSATASTARPRARPSPTQVAAWDPDVFAYLGDVYDRGTPFEFDTWYADPEGFGRFRGHHQPDGRQPRVHASATAQRRTSPTGASVPHYYSYDVGGWHVVVLDSTTEFDERPGWPASWSPGRRSTSGWPRTWPPTGSCTLAYMHHPRYSNVDGVSRDGLTRCGQLLVDRNVTMVLAGHAHTYERWTPLDGNGAPAAAGSPQFVVGTGGREILNPKVDRAAGRGDSHHPGRLRLDLGPHDAAFTFASTDGSFTTPARCRAASRPTSAGHSPSTPSASRPPRRHRLRRGSPGRLLGRHRGDRLPGPAGRSSRGDPRCGRNFVRRRRVARGAGGGDGAAATGGEPG